MRSFFHGLGKSSFTWRFARARDNLDRIRIRPFLGHGQANWSPIDQLGRFSYPVALPYPLLETGCHGLLGCLASMALIALPVARVAYRAGRANFQRLPDAAASTAAVLLAVNLVDLCLNSALLLPILVAAGGLAGWSPLTSSRPGRT